MLLDTQFMIYAYDFSLFYIVSPFISDKQKIIQITQYDMRLDRWICIMR